jgi:hypothetical protein
MASAVIVAVISLAPAPYANATGGTIVSPDPVGTTGAFSSLVLDAVGNPVVSYLDSPTTVKVLHCGNSTCSAGNTIAGHSTGGSFASESTALALSPAGNPVVVYSVGMSPGTKINLLRCNDPACASQTVSTLVTTGTLGSTPGLAVDSSDNPIVSYLDYVGVTPFLKVVHCGNPGCTAGNMTTSAGPNGYASSMRLDSAGNPVIAFEGAGNAISVLHCGNPSCTAGNTTTAFGGGRNPSLDLDSSGNPVVSYTASGVLSLIRCGNPTCSSGNTTTTIGPSRESWLALDAAGNPVISYYLYTTKDLQILHCDDPSCSGGGDVTTAPDTVGDVGQYSSVELDASGNPVVSYYDGTNGDLRALHCSDPTCSGVKVAPTPKPTATPPPPAPLDFHIAVDTDGNGSDDCSSAPSGPATCNLPPRSTFYVKLYVDGLGSVTPYAGYDGNLLVTGPTANSVVDFTPWPACGYPLSSPPFLFPVVGFGCAAFQQKSNYIGLLARVQLTCAASGTIDLRHGIGKTELSDSALVLHPEAPSGAETLQINCNSTPTPAPTSAAVGGVAFDASDDGSGWAWLMVAAFAGAVAVALSVGAAIARVRVR